ncbi:hypothetical protein, partial [Alkalicoccus chagannorensis]|uniref:hypothetical protein n=1 Tax=Alkalicoccus chagannorensis TaxID=427072 RepID=UPI0039EE6D67
QCDGGSIRCSGRNKERFLPSKSLQRFRTPFRPKGALRFCSAVVQTILIEEDGGYVRCRGRTKRFLSCKKSAAAFHVRRCHSRRKAEVSWIQQAAAPFPQEPMPALKEAWEEQ